MEDKFKNILRSTWWEILNSAFLVGIFVFCLQLCHKAENLNVEVKNGLEQNNRITLANENEVMIINQNVTKIEKEIANLQETIQQFYDNSKGEVFTSGDVGKTVRIFDLGDRSVIFFELKVIPIEQSVELSHPKGNSSPNTYVSAHNIVSLRTTTKSDELLDQENDFYHIKYHEDFSTDDELVTVKDMVYRGTVENPHEATLKKKSIGN